MATILKHKRSPFWQIKYLADDGLWRTVSSKVPVADGKKGKARAAGIAAEYSKREAPDARARTSERWNSWVVEFFNRKYGTADDPKNPKRETRLRAQAAWSHILEFLELHRIKSPRQLSYNTAEKFIGWRTTKQPGKQAAAHHNTAVTEIRFLSLVMREAVRRGMADANCIREVEARRIPGKQKDAFTAEQKELIEAKLKNAPQWMQEHWLVLTRQGCRCAEAFVPMHRISEPQNTMHLRLKGGKIHTAAIHPDLLPLIAKAREAKRETLVIAPGNPKNAPKEWWNFFRKECGIAASIHWVRVTVITRMLISGYTTAQVCAYIGHSEEVNKIYRKIKPHEVKPPSW
jgi:hypothetical protein